MKNDNIPYSIPSRKGKRKTRLLMNLDNNIRSIAHFFVLDVTGGTGGVHPYKGSHFDELENGKIMK